MAPPTNRARLVELILDDASVAQAQHAVGHAGDGGVVRDDDDGAAVLVVDILHELQDFLGRLVVERSRGLVAQQELRVFRDGTGNGHTLHLSAGHLIGFMFQTVTQSHSYQ